MNLPPLRRALPADIPAIAELMRRSTEEIGPAYYDARQTALASRYITNPDPDLIEDGTYFVVEAEDVLVGCGGWSRRKKLFTGSEDQEALSGRYLDPLIDAAKIRAFFVAPECVRRGIGRMLYSECEVQARTRGFKAFELMATLPGVPFYERLGFRNVEPENILLPNGEVLPCIKMRREI